MEVGNFLEVGNNWVIRTLSHCSIPNVTLSVLHRSVIVHVSDESDVEIHRIYAVVLLALGFALDGFKFDSIEYCRCHTRRAE